jgi:hypothetical protein
MMKTKKKRPTTGKAKSTHAPKDPRRIGPKSRDAENEPLHQPDYLLEDHPELGIPSIMQKVASPKQKRRTRK